VPNIGSLKKTLMTKVLLDLNAQGDFNNPFSPICHSERKTEK
jgi:hypothetical protein